MGGGLTTAGLTGIRRLAEEHHERGWHEAAQLAVYRDGRLELDLAVGAAAPDSWFLYFSATKPLCAVATLALVEQHDLSLEMPVAAVWPDFAQGGKHGCTIGNVLTHRGGFPVFPQTYDWRQIDDWSAVAAETAALPAVWEPGTDTGYHPVTYGFALGELVRRVDGREPRDFMREVVFEPIGMASSLGLPDDSDRGRLVLPVAMSEVTFADPEGSQARTSEIAGRFRLEATLRGQLPAANGLGTAEGLARFYAALERRWNGAGGLGAACPISSTLLRAATSVQNAVDLDRTTFLPASYGLGFLVGGAFSPFDQPRVFGHSGQQCVIAYADPDRRLAVAYVTNGLQDPLTVQLRTEQMVSAIAGAVGVGPG